MKKWYRGIVVKHKEIDNKMYHCFDDENFKILTKERNEQLKEIERLNNVIKEVREYIEEHKQKGYRTPMSDDYEFWNELDDNEIKELLEILDKAGDEK